MKVLSRLKPYAHAWLLCSFAAVALSMVDYTGKVARNEKGDDGVIQRIVFSGVLALLCLPILWLLRIFPEPSRSSGVRLVRRLFIGLVCGSGVAGLLLGIAAAGGKVDEAMVWLLVVFGPLFGLFAGIADTIALDGPIPLPPPPPPDDELGA